jgi:hypothetical protein
MNRSERQFQRQLRKAWPKVGDEVPVENCCREIRLGASSYKVGQMVSGWNTDTDEHEVWMVFRFQEDIHNPIMRRVQ